MNLNKCLWTVPSYTSTVKSLGMHDVTKTAREYTNTPIYLKYRTETTQNIKS